MEWYLYSDGITNDGTKIATCKTPSNDDIEVCIKIESKVTQKQVGVGRFGVPLFNIEIETITTYSVINNGDVTTYDSEEDAFKAAEEMIENKNT